MILFINGTFLPDAPFFLIVLTQKKRICLALWTEGPDCAGRTPVGGYPHIVPSR